MANRVEALLKGVGPLAEVCKAAIESAELNYDLGQSVVNACNVLGGLLQGEAADTQCGKICLAALLNASDVKLSKLWTVSEKGTLSDEIIVSAGMRELLQSLIA